MMTTQAESTVRVSRWRALLALVYGAACYLIFLCAFLYALGFVGDLVVPKSIDTGATVSPLFAALVDLALLGIFALQHSIMARPAFKQWWMHFVPRPIERSTYVLFASLALLLLYWQWLPLSETIWNLSNPLVRLFTLLLYGIGWLIVLLSSFLIDHGDLLGVRQVYTFWKAKDYPPPMFKKPLLYRLVRHPMMVGFLLAFWATPHMTVGHLLFSLATSGYTVVGIHLEERDLLAYYGAIYQRYQRQVRMLVPFPKQMVSFLKLCSLGRKTGEIEADDGRTV